MPLQDGIQVVLQHPLANGGKVCRGFTGLPIASHAWFCIDSVRAADDADAEQLGNDLAAGIRKLGFHVREVLPPCGGGSDHFGACHARNEPDCKKIRLVLIGKAKQYTQYQTPAAWQTHDPTFRLAPVFLTAASVNFLPSNLAGQNGFHWSKGDMQAATEILRIADIINERPRIFISYVRKDSHLIADQLFDHLTRRGFEVFLDRFSLPPGADFQLRLMEELARIGTVLVLDSPGVPTSSWVRLEVDFARLHRLGLLALRLPGGAGISGITSGRQMTLEDQDLTAKGRVRVKRLEDLLSRITLVHANAEQRRVAYLRDSLSSALSLNGFVSQGFDRFGVVVARKNEDFAFRVSHLPPEVGDFHALANYAHSHKATVFAPAKFMDWRARRPMDWVSRVSSIDIEDEADMIDKIKRLK